MNMIRTSADGEIDLRYFSTTKAKRVAGIVIAPPANIAIAKKEAFPVSDHIYKQVELTGSSKTSVEDAVQNAITKAGKTLHNIHWFQVVETRGYVANNAIDYWQVTIKLGFRLDD